MPRVSWHNPKRSRVAHASFSDARSTESLRASLTQRYHCAAGRTVIVAGRRRKIVEELSPVFPKAFTRRRGKGLGKLQAISITTSREAAGKGRFVARDMAT